MVQYEKKLLNSFCDIYAVAKYREVENSKNIKSQKKLVFKKKFSEDDEYCSVLRDVDDCSYVLTGIQDSATLYYIHLIFDSLVGRIMLQSKGKTGDVSGSLNIKVLKSFPIVEVSDDIKYTAAVLDASIIKITDMMNDDDKLYIQSVRNLMCELRDDFVAELYLKPLFEQHGISIIELLKNIVLNAESKSLTGAMLEIMKDITDPKSSLVSNMRRFRVLVGNVRVNQNSNK